MKFTKQSIEKLTLGEGKDEATFWCDAIPGFAIRLRGDSRMWTMQYSIGGKQRRRSLGSVDAIDLPTARKTAEKWHAKIKLGIDPASEVDSGRQRALELFSWGVDQFLAAKKPEVRPLYYNEMVRHLTQQCRALHKLQLEKITRRDIADLLNTFDGTVRNRVRASLSALYNHAMREGWCNSNPVQGTRRTEEKSRDHVLTQPELETIYRKAGDDQFGDIIRLLILTGARRTEIGSLRWDEVDWDEKEITIAKNRTKNGLEHVIPMSNPVMQILKPLYAKRADREFVFGLRDSGFGGWSKAKSELDKRLTAEKAAVADWRLHDLRRTTATRMADIGIQPDHIEAVLNHISGHKGGVAGVYNRSSYSTEKRIALNKWADVVVGKASNITELKRA